jgi:hypothetical protein
LRRPDALALAKPGVFAHPLGLHSNNASEENIMADQTTANASPAALSPFDLVVGFFQNVFTGSVDESPEHKAGIAALISNAFAPGYTFNGGAMAPKDLIGWREALLKQFGSMTFHVKNALSSPVDVGPGSPTTAVAISWQVDAVDSKGHKFVLHGMNMLSVRDGKAVSNVQLGDAGKGWVPVAA